MTPEMRKFIELLESQLGYSERSGAYTKFGNWYGENIEFDADYSSAPWCDMLLGWAATKLGYEEWMGQFAWTVAHAKWFRKQDAWGTEPEPGAFVFYDWSGSDSIGRIDHVGVVTKVEGGRIHTIEGNIDGGVAKRKERDTSKVVGYGYPWKIKERLDAEAAQQAADEAAALEAEAGVGTLQGDTGFVVLIPHVELDEQPKAPLAAAPEREQRKKKDETPAEAKKPEPETAATPETAAAPSSGAVKSPMPRTGKHAKPTTADTSAVTTGPIPVITDVSAATPASTVDSPALLTSALVAALAALALAKAKTRRLRPALAGAAAVASTPRSHRRRKSRKQARTPSGRPLQRPMELEPAPEPLVDGLEPVSALKSLRFPFPPEPVVIPEATSAFDAFSRPAPAPAQSLTWENDGSTRRLITDTGPIEIPREPGLYELPDPYSGFHLLGDASGPFPIREEPVLPRLPATLHLSGHRNGHPAARDSARRHHHSAAHDGRTQLDHHAAHDGRRQLDHHAAHDGGRQFGGPATGHDGGHAEEPFAPLRGRRHRQSLDVQRLEPFFPDAPLRGRRHRQDHETTHRSIGRTPEPALAGPSRSAERSSPTRETPRARKSRGRHRA